MHGAHASSHSKGLSVNCSTKWGTREFGVRQKLLDSVDGRINATAGDESLKKQLKGARRLLDTYPDKESAQ